MISAETVHDIKRQFLTRQIDVEELIKTLVEVESPSGDFDGSAAVVDVLVQKASELKSVGSVERTSVDGFGQHLVIEAFPEQQTTGQILLVGHTDTVHSRGSLAARPWRRDGNKIFGPGIFDMKANCALALEALRILEHLQVTPHFAVTIVLTSDEEVGSESGWPLIERIAKSRNTRCALVMEPPASNGRVKTCRKGTGIYQLKVEGIAAHAGLEPEKGASAILELARQIERIHTLNAAGTGITTNVGVVSGGTRSNVVAAEAEAEIDVRFSTEAESREVDHFLTHLKAIDDRTKVFVSGGINRPPLERTNGVIELFETARMVASMIDFDLGEAQVGGASDGNFIAALGIPVLDGLGINGDGAHAIHEHIIADDIPVRGTLLTGLIASVI